MKKTNIKQKVENLTGVTYMENQRSGEYQFSLFGDNTYPITIEILVDENGVVSQLKSICEEFNVNTSHVLYTIDNKWEEKNADMIFIEKLAISVVLCIILSVILELGYNKILANNKEKYELE